MRSRTITRSDQTWTTTFNYQTGLGTFNDYGQPWEIWEEQHVYQYRLTQRTFRHDFTPYVRGRIAWEQVTVRTAYDQTSGPAERTFTYQTSTGFLTRQVSDGISTTYEPTLQGNVAWVEDGRGNRTTYQYAWGRVSRVQTPNVTTDSAVNAEGTIASTTVGSLTATYTYDSGFRLTGENRPNVNPIAYEYDDTVGRIFRVRRDGVALSTQHVDGFGRVYFAQDAAGVKTRAEYNACGRQTFSSAPYTAGAGQHGVTTTYDGLGRPLTSTHTDGSVTTLTYGPTSVAIRDAENRTTTYDYVDFSAPLGERLVGVTDAAGQTTTYAYDARNNLTRVSVPGAPARTWTYAGTRLLSETHPESGTTTYTYDAAGNRTSRTDALTQTTQFAYDASDRLTGIDRPGSTDDVTITYDPIYGRVTSQATATATTTFGYDAGGRMASRTDTADGHTFTSTVTFDGNDLLRTMTYPSGRVITYEYDASTRLSTVKNNAAVFADLFTYGDAGALASYRTGAVTHTVALDTRQRINRLTSLNAAAQGLDLGYTYDRVSQVRQILDPRPGASQFFGYDELGRLSTASGPWGIKTWTYNAAGDRTSEQAGGVTNYTYDAATRRLTALSGAVEEYFTYDAIGRLASDARGSYSYNASGLLAQALTPTTVATYAYDPSGLRLTRTVNGLKTYTTRSLSGDVLSEFQDGCGSLVWTRDTVYAGGRLLGAVTANLASPSISMVAASVIASESRNVFAIEVQLTTPNGAPTPCPVTASYFALAGTADASDFRLPDGTVTFGPGTLSGATELIIVAIMDDELVEGEETFTVYLSSVNGGVPGAITSTTVVIQDLDFNGDGSPDLLWRRVTDGLMLVAYHAGVTLLSFAFTDPLSETDMNWEIRAVGDFNGDWKPDIVWQNRVDGRLFVWFLDRHIRIGSAAIDTLNGTHSEPDLAWKIVGAADMNRDGSLDLIWHRTDTGRVRIWHMNGTAQIDDVVPLYGSGVSGWRVAGVADMDGDGWNDLVWRDYTTGGLAASLMSDTQFLTVEWLTPDTLADVAWRIVGVRDMNGDGQADLIWQHDGTGEMTAWFMYRLGLLTWSYFSPNGSTDLNWKVVGVR